MDAIWIDDVDALREFCSKLEDATAIAVDTESDHYHAYDPQICLIQVASRDHAALIDPIRLDDEDLGCLFDLLEDPDVVKILHSARNDIGELDRDYGVRIHNLFDTQVAARFLGYERCSLDWLLEEIVGVKPSGKFGRFDWTMRPIPEDARYYAVMDVAHLHDLRDHFLDELEETGWARAFDETCEYFARSSDYEPVEFDPEGWRRLRGADDLNGPGRAAARELFALRHEICRRLNRAAVHIFDNNALVDLARRRPTSPSGLRDVRGRIVAQVRHEEGDAIIEAIERSRNGEIPPEKPPRESGGRRRISPEERERYNALRKWRNETAEQYDIPPAYVATNATLSEIARVNPAETSKLGQFEPLLPWQIEQFGEEMIGILRGD